MLRAFDGAVVRRVIDRGRSAVPEHAHDFPMLSIFVMGSYLNQTEVDRQFICVPSVVFYRAGALHRNEVAAHGFEQLEIEFDPEWIGQSLLPEAPVKRWLGGTTPEECARLLKACASHEPEGTFRAALKRFLASETHGMGRRQPWLDTVVRKLRDDANLRIQDLARSVSRHPAWIGSAYRQVTGESLQDTAARLRVERAAYLLRETDQAMVGIAAEAGFCDQSHMNRTFKRIVGRSPTEVRRDREHFRARALP
jgi:AraC family transcriptional regulator